MSAWKDKFISLNKYSRSGQKLKGVKKLVIHWTANYGAGAENHYRYFNNLRDRYASAHIFVDSKESLCIIPLNEVAYHANDGSYRGVSALKPNANLLSIGVEMCVEKDGTFHPNTISQTEDVMVELCKRYGLNPLTDIVRHYDITRKSCPAPWVKNSSHFTSFKNRVNAKLRNTTGAASVIGAPSVNKDYLEKNNTGAEVKKLQENLNKLGFNVGVADGIYGNMTESAVVALQKKYNLDVDGIAGKQVLGKIEELLNTKTEAKESVRMYKPSNKEFINATSIVLNRLASESHGDKAIDPIHREKLLKGELPLDDALALLYVAIERSMIIGEGK